MRFAFPVDQVIRVDLGHGVVSRPILVVCLTVLDPEGREMWVQMSPSLEGWRIPFSRLKVAKVEEIGEVIRSRIEDEKTL